MCSETRSLWFGMCYVVSDRVIVGKVISKCFNLHLCELNSDSAEVPTITHQRSQTFSNIRVHLIWRMDSLVCQFHAWCVVIVVWYCHELNAILVVCTTGLWSLLIWITTILTTAIQISFPLCPKLQHSARWPVWSWVRKRSQGLEVGCPICPSNMKASWSTGSAF